MSEQQQQHKQPSSDGATHLVKADQPEKKAGSQIDTAGRAKIYSVLAKVQAEMKEPERSAQGHGYKYAPLEKIREISRPILSKYGLSILHFPYSTSEWVGIKTYIMHESGHHLASQIEIPVSGIVQRGNYAQQAGAVITYLTRYVENGILRISGEDDTDGVQPKTKAQTELISEDQRRQVFALLKEKGYSKEWVYKVASVDSLTKLTKNQATHIIKKLREADVVH